MSLKSEIKARVTAVPALPDAIVKLREYCNDPDVSYADMARVIEADAGLTASILRLGNSAYFGCTGTISSIQFAMTRLGLKRIHQMALAICVAPMANDPIPGYVLDAGSLWDHTLAVAMASEKLAQHVVGVEPSDAFTAGMLHDMGKTVLGMFVQDEIEEIRRLVRDEGYAFDEAERSVLGVDHSAVGAMLLRHWNIPAHVVEAVRWHHKPTRGEDHESLTDVVHVADVLCMDIGWGQGFDGLQYRQDDRAADRLAVDNFMGEQVVCEVVDELAELKDILTTSQEVSVP